MEYICKDCNGRIINTSSEDVCMDCGIVHSTFNLVPDYYQVREVQDYDDKYQQTRDIIHVDDNFNLPDRVFTLADEIFSEYTQIHKVHGYYYKYACIFIAYSYLCEHNITVRDLFAGDDDSIKKIYKCYDSLFLCLQKNQRLSHLIIKSDDGTKNDALNSLLHNFLKLFRDSHQDMNKLYLKCHNIMDAFKHDNVISGFKDSTFVGGVIYYILNKESKRSIKFYSIRLNISVPTLRKVYTIMHNRFG